jgi:chemotaxis signal transduction protein
VPGAPDALLGVANLSGLPRSVFDLGRLLNVRSTFDEPYIVLLSVEGKAMGLAVDGVEEIRRIESDKLLPVDDAASDSAVTFTKGLTDERIAVLDANALLHHVAHELDAPAGKQVAIADAAVKNAATTRKPAGTSPEPQFRRES